MITSNYWCSKFVCGVLINLITLLSQLRGSHSLDNGVAQLPPMGWSTWNVFGCTKCENLDDTEDCLSESTIKNMADLLVIKGFRDLGYEYILIDDCWQRRTRDFENKLRPDPIIFPSGMKALAKYVHDKNLKLGIFSDLGPKTGNKYPGSSGHLETDANTFAEWDMDYVKMSAFTEPKSELQYDYIHFGECLSRTNRPMVYATSWPIFAQKVDLPMVAANCNTWRFSGDAVANWKAILAIMDAFSDKQLLYRIAHGGAWNDADLLLAGTGITVNQAKSQMAVWSIIPSPLIFSTDFKKLSTEMKAVLQNKKVIAVNQDPLRLSGYKLLRQGDLDLWMRAITPVANGHHSFAIAFVNRNSDHEIDYETTFEALGLRNPAGYYLTDLFLDATSHEPVFPSTNIKLRINESDVRMYKTEAIPERRVAKLSPVDQSIYQVTRYQIHN